MSAARVASLLTAAGYPVQSFTEEDMEMDGEVVLSPTAHVQVSGRSLFLVTIEENGDFIFNPERRTIGAILLDLADSGIQPLHA